MKKLAPVQSVVVRSPAPESIYPGSPGILSLPGGRLIATNDFGGPGVEKMPGEKGVRWGRAALGRISVSDDGGDTWRAVRDFPFIHARPFYAGGSVYIIGHCMDLMIMRSDDDGETWSEISVLSDPGQSWHQAPCNVWHAKGNVYLVMERYTRKGWAQEIAPVLMRGKETDDLTQRENWAFASELPFYEAADVKESHLFGMPMYDLEEAGGKIGGGRHCAPWGWLETNVVQILDPDHIWHDETGHTFHLFARAHTAHTNYACVMKVVEKEDGSMETMLEKTPSGETWLYLPWPGGQMKFHMLYDEETKTYWLLSTQSTSSMIRPDRLGEERYGLPDNERKRLQLHFSKNCVDWCFAGLVDMGKEERESRHYASMCIRGEDLCILSRSGDQESICAHNCNIITFHTVKNFRELIY